MQRGVTTSELDDQWVNTRSWCLDKDAVNGELEKLKNYSN